jgi:hypothetical protein
MSEIDDFRRGWVDSGRPLPLEVRRSDYDEETVSWEVLYTNSPWDGNSGCSAPIAEFGTWGEAQAWAARESAVSKCTYDSRVALGPMTRYQQAHADAWEAFGRGEGPHPYTTDHERLALL